MRRLLDSILAHRDALSSEINTYPGAFAEAISACMLTAWGTILLLPHNTFTTAQSFRAMAYIAPEWAWGLFALIVGSLALRAMVFGSISQRRNFQTIILGTWTCIAMVFIVGNPFGTSTAIYPLIAYCARAAERGLRWRT